MNKKLLAIAIVATLSAGSSFASDMAVEEKMAAQDSYMVPPYQSTTYTFDEDATKKMLESTSALLQLKCDAKKVLNVLGFTQGADRMLSVGLNEGNYEYNFDFRSCTMWLNNPNVSREYTKTITENDALSKANEFVKSTFLQSTIYNKLGTAKIIYKNSNQPIPMYDVRSADKDESISVGNDIVIIEDSETPEKIEREYYSFSILFPYTINGQPVYNQYGQAAGVTVEVSANGVMSANVQLLPFMAVRKDADKLTGQEAVDFIKRGGNSPFWGQAQEVKLKGPERVFVLFNFWRNNKTETYISSGIRFGSDVKTDYYAQQNYEMVLSDYKIGNYLGY